MTHPKRISAFTTTQLVQPASPFTPQGMKDERHTHLVASWIGGIGMHRNSPADCCLSWLTVSHHAVHQKEPTPHPSLEPACKAKSFFFFFLSFCFRYFYDHSPYYVINFHMICFILMSFHHFHQFSELSSFSIMYVPVQQF